MTWIEHLENLKENIIRKETLLESYTNELNNVVKTINDLKEKEVLYSETMDFLSSVLVFSRNRIKSHFEDFITYILQYVMGKSYSFVIEWDFNNKNTYVNFLVKNSDGGNDLILEPTFSHGGGICDIIGFGFRLAFLSLYSKGGFIFLDETFSQLSSMYIPNLSNLLQDIKDKFGYQIILITHNTDMSLVDNNFNIVNL